VPILDRDLQAHRAGRHLRERPARFDGHVAHGEPVLSLQLFANALPPQVDRASAVRKDVDLPRPPAGLAHFALLRQPDLDQLLDRAGQVAPPQVGLVLGALAAPEFEASSAPRTRATAPSLLVGFGRVAGDGQRVVAVTAAVDVRDRELGLEDRRL
jgi:hypothetical protein